MRKAIALALLVLLGACTPITGNDDEENCDDEFTASMECGQPTGGG